MSNTIIDSYNNGQKKQAVEQFKDLSEYDQINFLVDNILNKSNDLLLIRLMETLVTGSNKYDSLLRKKS